MRLFGQRLRDIQIQRDEDVASCSKGCVKALPQREQERERERKERERENCESQTRTGICP
jgi:hypothetical protein